MCPGRDSLCLKGIDMHGFHYIMYRWKLVYIKSKNYIRWFSFIYVFWTDEQIKNKHAVLGLSTNFLNIIIKIRKTSPCCSCSSRNINLQISRYWRVQWDINKRLKDDLTSRLVGSVDFWSFSRKELTKYKLKPPKYIVRGDP